MSLYGAFSTSVLGMISQGYSLGVIGSNVSNVNTGGYRETDTQFSTVLGKTYGAQSDIGGVKPNDYQRISKQGIIISTSSEYDLSINGIGFFVLNTEADGSGDTLYTRDGMFSFGVGPEITVTVNGDPVITNEGYLVDKNGYFVQSWTPDASGNFSTAGTLASTRIDPWAFALSQAETTIADLNLNLPAELNIGDTSQYNLDVYDSNGTRRSPILNFTKTAANTWQMSMTTDDIGDTVNSTPQTIAFSPLAVLPGTTTYAVDITWADGATTNVILDVSDLSQFAGPFMPQSYSRDGYGTGSLKSTSFDQFGHMVGNFDDAGVRKLYKLPLAIFPNPDGLAHLSGNVFKESADSGSVSLAAADSDGYATFGPQSRELSNVDLADQFSKMIMTQTAYNGSATVFKTVDEMVSIARDLKR